MLTDKIPKTFIFMLYLSHNESPEQRDEHRILHISKDYPVISCTENKA